MLLLAARRLLHTVAMYALCCYYVLLSNSALAGGAIYLEPLDPTDLVVSDCTFTANTAIASAGGAILQRGEVLQVQTVHNRFVNNTGKCAYAGPDLTRQTGGSDIDVGVGYGTSW
jgi:hypothetical protein